MRALDVELDANWTTSQLATRPRAALRTQKPCQVSRAHSSTRGRDRCLSRIGKVSSNSTVKLITKAIAELKANPKIGRAEALRRSMLSLITTGKEYEAHPAHGALFVLVGEGGAAR